MQQDIYLSKAEGCRGALHTLYACAKRHNLSFDIVTGDVARRPMPHGCTGYLPIQEPPLSSVACTRSSTNHIAVVHATLGILSSPTAPGSVSREPRAELTGRRSDYQAPESSASQSRIYMTSQGSKWCRDKRYRRARSCLGSPYLYARPDLYYLYLVAAAGEEHQWPKAEGGGCAAEIRSRPGTSCWSENLQFACWTGNMH